MTKLKQKPIRKVDEDIVRTSGFDIPSEDKKTIDLHGQTAYNLRFKNYVEKLLRDHAETIRKKQSK